MKTERLFLGFSQFFQRKPERRVVQGLTGPVQRVFGRFSEFSGGGYGWAALEGNLHLDADSANLASSVLQHNHEFRCKLAQFCGEGGVAHGDAEQAGLQPQHLAGLCEIGRCNTYKMAMQGRQGLCLDH